MEAHHGARARSLPEQGRGSVLQQAPQGLMVTVHLHQKSLVLKDRILNFVLVGVSVFTLFQSQRRSNPGEEEVQAAVPMETIPRGPFV